MTRRGHAARRAPATPRTPGIDPRPAIYLDHAATSWPKPQPVIEAVTHALTHLGGNPGRGAYQMALAASRAVFEARRECAALLGVADPSRLVFQPSCTAACNLMLKGSLREGERVVVGSMEHNAIARPLARLASRAGVEVVVVQADPSGLVDPGDIEREVRAAPTRAVVCQHASNVTGAIQPLQDLADIAREAGALLLVDGAQGAGHLDVDLGELGADAYAASGHKGLLGPQGVGLLYVRPGLILDEQIEGGTGAGASESLEMPPELPDRYEAGTANMPGIAGLGAGVRFLAAQGSAQREREAALARRLHEGILGIRGFRVLGPPPKVDRVPLVAAVHAEVEADRIAFELDRAHGIAVRAGLHCAPWAHDTVGTLACGAVRFGIGWDTTQAQVDRVLEVLAGTVA
ncbi:MAG: aminotransferase class V-fold PLP-dependent enzyme [Clostridiales bacterium]|nr:aminotransferase class V-fold PLP-dependent enzyme [Clostridiales bacterium]